jgi:diacylglycerol kinase family enzyme
MRHFFVINPHSFRTLKSWKQIMMDLENCFSVGRRTEYKIYTSRHPRDAIAAVDRYLLSVPPDETVRVYAVGGDGILFDCLNGMVDFPNAELTSVPYGNANDFVRAFGEGVNPAFRDIKKLSASPSFPVDIIKCGTNYALNEANIGIIGQTMLYANAILRRATRQWIKRVTPHIYTVSGLRAMLNKDVLYQNYTVNMDGEDLSGQYGNIHFSNGPCNGGVMTPSPYAIPDDGLLNVIFIRGSHVLKIAQTLSDYESGRFEKQKKG